LEPLRTENFMGIDGAKHTATHGPPPASRSSGSIPPSLFYTKSIFSLFCASDLEEEEEEKRRRRVS
jgi:hypothetical protein